MEALSFCAQPGWAIQGPTAAATGAFVKKYMTSLPIPCGFDPFAAILPIRDELRFAINQPKSTCSGRHAFRFLGAAIVELTNQLRF
jgi:hypothetical protein